MNKLASIYLVGGAALLGSSNITAQSISLEYTGEWQTDFRGGYDWLNLLNVRGEAPLAEGLSVQASAISMAKTGHDTLADDLLTYSNIEAGNIPLTLSRLGISYTHRGAELFAGINNAGEDYFTSAVTAFFTNSPCGISPTIANNFEIASYPEAAWCLHYRQRLGAFSLQTSIYPGRGYHRLAGHDNLFSLNPGRDGIFSITSFDYQRHGIYCVLGIAVNHGVCVADAQGEQSELTAHPTQKKTTAAAPWLLTEVTLHNGIAMLAHGSVSTISRGCKGYAGIGAVYTGRRIEPGISLNHALFTGVRETDLEVTARMEILSGRGYLQPALHVLGTSSGTACIGMLRLGITM